MRNPSVEQDEWRSLGPALALLAISLLINYVDRGNLSIAAPILKDELRISGTQLGILFSAFFYTYTFFIFVSGWLVDRFNVNWVLALGFALWSLATAGTGFVRGFQTLLAARLLLGIGESVAFPAMSKILGRGLPETRRGFANGIVIGAMKSGPAVGTLGAGLLMASYGWRPVFVGIGLVSLLWIPPWLKWCPFDRGEAPIGTPTASTAQILARRSFWGCTLGHFGNNYILYFLVSWLPFYLVHEHRLTMQSMAKAASAYYLLDAASALATGWFTDFCIRSGRSVTAVRKTAMGVGHCASAIGLAGCAAASQEAYLPWLAVIALGSGMAGSGVFAFAQTLAGPAAVGRWTGLQNGSANVAGIVGPALTGYLFDRTEHFTLPLAITAAVSLVAGLSWVFLVREVKPVNWTESSPAELSREA